MNNETTRSVLQVYQNTEGYFNPANRKLLKTGFLSKMVGTRGFEPYSLREYLLKQELQLHRANDRFLKIIF